MDGEKFGDSRIIIVVVSYHPCIPTPSCSKTLEKRTWNEYKSGHSSSRLRLQVRVAPRGGGWQ